MWSLLDGGRRNFFQDGPSPSEITTTIAPVARSLLVIVPHLQPHPSLRHIFVYRVAATLSTRRSPEWSPTTCGEARSRVPIRHYARRHYFGPIISLLDRPQSSGPWLEQLGDDHLYVSLDCLFMSCQSHSSPTQPINITMLAKTMMVLLVRHLEE